MIKPVDEILRWVDAAGGNLKLDEGGQPRLIIPREKMSPELLETLKDNRAALIERLKPVKPRRIVTCERQFGPILTVLEYCDPAGFLDAVRRQAAKNPNVLVAGEHMIERGDFVRQWTRFVWLNLGHSITATEGVLCDV